MPEIWTPAEVKAIIDDYLVMLKAELTHRPYSKADHRRSLRDALKRRSDGAIERKHQNISAVLLELGLPYIDGYKPLTNYQQSLIEAV